MSDEEEFEAVEEPEVETDESEVDEDDGADESVDSTE